jgi:hypothetical protein
MQTALNPLTDLRRALKRAKPCTHHPEVVVSTSRQNAADWWEAFNLCETPRRLEHLRWMGQHDLWFLLYYLLHRRHLDTDFHFDRCTEIRKNPNNNLDLWFRESGKSELLTFGLVIQDILNDPNITIGIFSHTRPIAKGFLRLIQRSSR